MKQQNILIIGAGLCGSLLALRLGQRGYNVTVYEMRPDLRKTDISAGRSINLAFSDRGEKAMKLVGIEEKVKTLCIPMNGRMLHDKDGNTFLSNYSGREYEYINSISRGGLNALLLDEAETHKNVKIHFNKRCQFVDFEKTTATFIDTVTNDEFIEDADTIIATDGAGSALRRSYYLERKFLFSFSQDYLTHGYKELAILPTEDSDYKTYKNALHIWPRGDFMIIALPNLDGSFTVTLFLSYDQGEYNFNNLTTPEIVTEFFQKEFPDALDIMPNLVDDFFENPTAPLGTVKCTPWHYKGNTLLMGDSAHAIVPFYGQGMNASFEDVVEFDAVLDKYEGDWETIFSEYEKTRKKDTDAIADLAIDNFHEMKDHVANPIFQEKRKIEMALERLYPENYSSKYSLVTFNEHIGYREAMLRGRAQDKAILNMISDGTISADIDLTDKTLVGNLLDKVKTETNAILEDDKVAGLH
ncbi:NAD(P)/FAD-dependent oxidoreductase [Psychroserpens sp.]|uniref:FAD-dependent oxidoreductase n=1 Tax=Psychroserpens sp. TaxID=2020870 RepID=UPI001B099696|nr:NAD(P)/FAD-dependent oxidoreductase [Psychroserpens sp.]MBO6605942.1 FAD-dependent monooxygenase [Psychroserpens sp.]MBO6652687.1 FAD-dependent monooxygenase [Psychroserpens sp.]MBO6681541.1 FAD-dependent monooxygenase [Psychroserpens sp.]MBO6749316.1 FAD-dependent monooxygenase [Psychroserpens sp.]MBO6914238.1 FAD-dependent monooxygenase [Psychroserpens sp.]